MEARPRKKAEPRVCRDSREVVNPPPCLRKEEMRIPVQEIKNRRGEGKKVGSLDAKERIIYRLRGGSRAPL